MPAPRESQSEPTRSRRRPATTPEERENQLTAAAYDLAEKQIAAGTASAQVLTHFLKLGSSREQLEQYRMTQEIEIMKAKAELIAQGGRIEALYNDALNAMRSYQGQPNPETPDDLEA